MNLLYLDFFGIGKTIQDFFRGIFWGAIRVLMQFITGMMEALTEGIMSFPILENTYIKQAFNASLAIMFLVIVPKIIYEIVLSMLKDDEAGLDYGKKIGGAVLGVIIASTLSITIVMGNTLTVNITKALTTQNVNSAIKEEQMTDQPTTKQNLGDALLSSVFVGFGGMKQGGEFGADKLVSSYESPGDEFDIYERDDGYVWEFSELMVLIGMIIYIILLFMISIQVATRIMAIGFYYVIGPLCCLSLTNYQNPQAFTVWKNSLLGQFFMNVTQIFLLGFFSGIVADIGNIGSTTGLVGGAVIITQLILYFAGFSVILTMPSFVQSMLGGYGAGVMDTVSQIRGGLSMGKAMTVGAVSAGIGKAVGRQNSFTGHREGGLRGALAGNKKQDGTRQGGITGNTIGNKDRDGNRHGGIRGVFAGDKRSTDKSGSTERSGGALGAMRGTKSTTRNQSGASSTSYSGGLRSLARGTTTISRSSGGATLSKESTGNVISRGAKHVRDNPFRKNRGGS